MKISTKTQRLTAAGLCVCLGIMLPYVCAHSLGLAETVLLPMHIPVLLCGFLCGAFYGSACGLILPLISSLLTGMPSVFPMLPIMCAELCAYGTVSGLLHKHTALGKHKWGIYVTLLSSMLVGRVIYALVFNALLIANGSLRAPSVLAALIAGLPGIAVQLLLIPIVIIAIGAVPIAPSKNAVASAKNLLLREKATCVVIRDGKIINIEYGRGIKPILKIYEEGLLKNAIVVDKIVGRAAAMIMVLGGVSQCFGRTVSKGAVEVFKKHGIYCEYEEASEYIINRSGDGLCPMEEAVMGIDNPEVALQEIKKRLDELSKNDM